jgi:transcriptional repressor NrdR
MWQRRQRRYAQNSPFTRNFPVENSADQAFAGSSGHSRPAYLYQFRLMKCPFCNADDTSVIDSRVSEEGNRIRRRRRCPICDKRFTTYETVELRLPQVVKQDGNRSEFNRDKMLISFVRALHKRPVPTECVDAAVDRIIQKLLSLGEREISSRMIGEMVMQELYRLDKVAYIRFASVYRSFQDADDFRDAIKEVQKVEKIPKPSRELVEKMSGS